MIVAAVLVAALVEEEVVDGQMAEAVLHVSIVIALTTDHIVAGKNLENQIEHRSLQRYRIHLLLFLLLVRRQ